MFSDFVSYDSNSLTLTCSLQPFAGLAKPLFTNKTNFRDVYILVCLLPENSYADLFEKLNINASYIHKLTIFELPHQLHLSGAHFAGLNLRELYIKCLETDTLLHITGDVLESLKHVQLMSFQNVILSPMPEDSNVVVIMLDTGRSEGVLGGCSNLRALAITRWDISTRNWLSNCTKLQHLWLSRLSSIFTLIWMLEGAKSLQEVEIKDCDLPMLTRDLFLHSVNLKKLSVTNSNVNSIQ